VVEYQPSSTLSTLININYQFRPRLPPPLLLPDELRLLLPEELPLLLPDELRLLLPLS